MSVAPADPEPQPPDSMALLREAIAQLAASRRELEALLREEIAALS